MKLATLERVDPAAVKGILAAAALASAPDPGVGERPALLRTYEREATAVLSEIYDRLNISRENNSPQARVSISKAIAEALRQSILPNINVAEVLSRVGSAGLLAPSAYNVIQPDEFRAVFYNLGVTRNHVDDAVKQPDDHQHLMTEGMPEHSQDLSLFMKRVMSRDPVRRHWLLVQAHRVGIDQKVGAAWRVYPDDVNIELAQKPIDVLKAFVLSYGVPVRVGDTRGLFIESQTYPGGSQVKIDWTSAPPEHFLSAAHTTSTVDGMFRFGIAYCIDLPKYRLALKRRGVKVIDPGPPNTQAIVQTTTTRPADFPLPA